MNRKEEEKLSKYLCYLLRHNPKDLELEEGGWIHLNLLIEALNYKGWSISEEDIYQLVGKDSKGRYSIKDNRIRCNQGHSIGINLQLEPREPPIVLYHGTSNSYIESIKERGLISGRRDYVHLTDDIELAMSVGKRHKGIALVLSIDTKKMSDDGYKFLLSDNGIWLTERVPIEYIKELNRDKIDYQAVAPRDVFKVKGRLIYTGRIKPMEY